jgi:hypothetical protein
MNSYASDLQQNEKMKFEINILIYIFIRQFVLQQ